jgi:hypothetical protein
MNDTSSEVAEEKSYFSLPRSPLLKNDPSALVHVWIIAALPPAVLLAAPLSGITMQPCVPP